MENNILNIMDKLSKIPKRDLDYLMQSSYDNLTKNLERTLYEFVVFEEGDLIVEVPKGVGQRSLVIDKMIKYFEKIEQYEKCAKLVKLKDQIVKFGD